MEKGLLKKFESGLINIMSVGSLDDYNFFFVLDDVDAGRFICFKKLSEKEFIKLDFNEIPFDLLFSDAISITKNIVSSQLKSVDLDYRNFVIRFENEHFIALPTEKMRLLDILESQTDKEIVKIGTSLQFTYEQYKHFVYLNLDDDTYFYASFITNDLTTIIVDTFQKYFKEAKIKETKHKVIISLKGVRMVFYKSNSCNAKFEYQIEKE